MLRLLRELFCKHDYRVIEGKRDSLGIYMPAVTTCRKCGKWETEKL